MKLELTDQEFRYLLDLVYIGNWVLNSTRGDDRIEEYDQVEGKVFYELLAEELALRDLDGQPLTRENYDALMARIDAYLSEFDEHGTDRVTVDLDEG